MLEKSWDRFEGFLSSLVAPTHVEIVQQRHSPESTSTATSKDIDWAELAVELAFRVSVAVALTAVTKWIVSKYLEPMLDAEKQDRQPSDVIYKRIQLILKKRGYDGPMPVLNSYERQMAEDLLDPDDIDNSFADIGGLDATKREIYELAIIPLLQPDLFTGKLVQPCKGVLLYGKPGTGNCSFIVTMYTSFRDDWVLKFHSFALLFHFQVKPCWQKPWRRSPPPSFCHSNCPRFSTSGSVNRTN